ncbi:MAG: sigma 54-interacting transcriptional regulator [Planctomycetes bacterium]|nr:sigma 54-interacting transcriptional regulator [Planctomycetota bacterium]
MTQLEINGLTIRRLQLINTIVTEMCKGSRIEDIVEVVHRELREMIAFDRIGIAMIDRDRDDLDVTVLKTQGEVHLPIGHLNPTGDPRLQSVIWRGESFICGDLKKFLERHPESDSARRLTLEGMHSNMALPLVVGTEVLGYMSMSSRQPEAFTEEHGQILQEISGHVAVAAEKARLISQLSEGNRRLEQANRELQEANQLKAEFLKKVGEEVERQTEQLGRAGERERRLLRIANAVNASLDLNNVFHVAVQELRDLIPFDRASITLVDETGQNLRFAALEPPEREILGKDATIPLRGTSLGEAILSGRTVLRTDLSQEPRRAEEDLLFSAGIRSCLFTPLVLRGSAIGTFNLSSVRPNAYGQGEAVYIDQVAQNITHAVANARAYEEIQRLKEELHRENVYLKDELSTEHHFFEIVGTHPQLTHALRDAERVALTDATVLIRGETGTGKELIARAIHRLSSRRDRALIKVNCAALPETLIASELFGHEKGAFTGAVARKLGRFELAEGGTIFLDEIGDLPAEIQVKVLRVLQEREFERVGGTQTLKADVRIIAATNRDLEALVASGSFRQDLYYRLNVFPVTLPPLRERPDDIRELAMHFVRKYARRQNKRITRISHRSMNLLQTYHWSGNVRELENLIERAVILCEGDTLSIDERWLHPPSGSVPPGEFKSIEEMEQYCRDLQKRFFQNLLQTTRGRVYGPKGAASILGLKPTTLQGKLKRLGL